MDDLAADDGEVRRDVGDLALGAGEVVAVRHDEVSELADLDFAATSAVCTSLRCCGPARAAGVARGVRGCGRAGGLLRSPVAGGGS